MNLRTCWPCVALLCLLLYPLTAARAPPCISCVGQHHAGLVPSNPEMVMVIRQVTPQILTLSVPFARYGQIKIGGRATIVRFADGTLAVFSPVALTSNVKKHISKMGSVKYLIAPDVEHHLFLDAWHEAYPKAKLIGPEELRVKREKMGKPLPWTYLWKKDTPPSVDPDFDKEFDYAFVWSHPNHELVFHHKPTRTLIEADLWFNMPCTEQYSRTMVSATSGYLTKAFTFVNSYKTDVNWQRRFIWYWESSNDRPSFDKDMKTIYSWNFDRIIPCHGDVVEKEGKKVFGNVFLWHLDATKRPVTPMLDSLLSPESFEELMRLKPSAQS